MMVLLSALLLILAAIGVLLLFSFRAILLALQEIAAGLAQLTQVIPPPVELTELEQAESAPFAAALDNFTARARRNYAARNPGEHNG